MTTPRKSEEEDPQDSAASPGTPEENGAPSSTAPASGASSSNSQRIDAALALEEIRMAATVMRTKAEFSDELALLVAIARCQVLKERTAQQSPTIKVLGERVSRLAETMFVMMPTIESGLTKTPISSDERLANEVLARFEDALNLMTGVTPGQRCWDVLDLVFFAADARVVEIVTKLWRERGRDPSLIQVGNFIAIFAAKMGMNMHGCTPEALDGLYRTWRRYQDNSDRGARGGFTRDEAWREIARIFSEMNWENRKSGGLRAGYEEHLKRQLAADVFENTPDFLRTRWAVGRRLLQEQGIETSIEEWESAFETMTQTRAPKPRKTSTQ